MLKDYEIKDRALDQSLTLMLPDGAPVLPLLREKVEDGLEHALVDDRLAILVADGKAAQHGQQLRLLRGGELSWKGG